MATEKGMPAPAVIARRSISISILVGAVLASRPSHAVAQPGPVVGWGPSTAGGSAPPGGFRAIDAGGFFSVGIRADGTLAAWGDNTYGQLNVPSGTFIAVDAAGVVENSYGLAIRTDGTLAGWGTNVNHVLEVPSGQFIAVAAGDRHGIAMRPDGTLVGWGNNVNGQATVPPGSYAAIAAGDIHSLALVPAPSGMFVLLAGCGVAMRRRRPIR
jgi:hypothetical protein